MPRLWVNNALTWTQARRVYVNNSGTWTSIRAIWVNNGGTWAKAFSRSDTLAMVAGRNVSGPFITTGYSASLGIGSLAPTALTPGGTVIGVTDDGGLGGLLELSISPNPGAAYITQVTANGVTKLASAASYSYGGTTASWLFSGLFGFVNGGSYTVEIELP